MVNEVTKLCYEARWVITVFCVGLGQWKRLCLVLVRVNVREWDYGLRSMWLFFRVTIGPDGFM